MNFESVGGFLTSVQSAISFDNAEEIVMVPTTNLKHEEEIQESRLAVHQFQSLWAQSLRNGSVVSARMIELEERIVAANIENERLQEVNRALREEIGAMQQDIDETSVERDPIVFYLESVQPELILNLMLTDGARDPEDLQLIDETLVKIRTRIPKVDDSELVQVNGKFVDFALKLTVISAYDYLYSESNIDDQRKKMFEHFGSESGLQTRRRRTRDVETSDW